MGCRGDTLRPRKSWRSRSSLSPAECFPRRLWRALRATRGAAVDTVEPHRLADRLGRIAASRRAPSRHSAAAMASARAMKRMQGDALLQAAERAYGGDVASDEDSSDEDDAPARAPLNAFALLGGDDDEEDEEAGDERKEVRTARDDPSDDAPRRDLLGTPNSPRSDPSTPALPPSSQLTPAPAPGPRPRPSRRRRKRRKRKSPRRRRRRRTRTRWTR